MGSRDKPENDGWGLAALAAALLLSSIWSAASAAPPSPEGVWRTPTHKGLVEMFRCGPAICGRLLSSDNLEADPNLKDVENRDPALRGRPVKDLVILWGFSGGPVSWGGGKAYNPQDGRTYHGSFKVIDARTLRLTGCAIFPLCQTQTWTRVE